jgi:hypothetical protein
LNPGNDRVDLDLLVSAVARRLTSTRPGSELPPPNSPALTSAVELPLDDDAISRLASVVAQRLIELASSGRDELPVEQIQI